MACVANRESSRAQLAAFGTVNNVPHEDRCGAGPRCGNGGCSCPPYACPWLDEEGEAFKESVDAAAAASLPLKDAEVRLEEFEGVGQTPDDWLLVIGG